MGDAILERGQQQQQLKDVARVALLANEEKRGGEEREKKSRGGSPEGEATRRGKKTWTGKTGDGGGGSLGGFLRGCCSVFLFSLCRRNKTQAELFFLLLRFEKPEVLPRRFL